jgi:hypothetical protein
MFEDLMKDLSDMIGRADKVKQTVDHAGNDGEAPQKIEDDLGLGEEMTAIGPDDLSPTREQAELIYASRLESQTRDLSDKLAKYIFKG